MRRRGPRGQSYHSRGYGAAGAKRLYDPPTMTGNWVEETRRLEEIAATLVKQQPSPSPSPSSSSAGAPCAAQLRVAAQYEREVLHRTAYPYDMMFRHGPPKADDPKSTYVTIHDLSFAPLTPTRDGGTGKAKTKARAAVAVAAPDTRLDRLITEPRLPRAPPLRQERMRAHQQRVAEEQQEVGSYLTTAQTMNAFAASRLASSPSSSSTSSFQLHLPRYKGQDEATVAAEPLPSFGRRASFTTPVGGKPL